jgi:hypothetical protein
MDVYPDIKPPYQDTDVAFNTTDYCFAWRGFGHHENVQLMAGIGTRRKSHGVVFLKSVNRIFYTLVFKSALSTVRFDVPF